MLLGSMELVMALMTMFSLSPYGREMALLFLFRHRNSVTDLTISAGAVQLAGSGKPGWAKSEEMKEGKGQ